MLKTELALLFINVKLIRQSGIQDLKYVVKIYTFFVLETDVSIHTILTSSRTSLHEIIINKIVNNNKNT